MSQQSGFTPNASLQALNYTATSHKASPVGFTRAQYVRTNHIPAPGALPANIDPALESRTLSYKSTNQSPSKHKNQHKIHHTRSPDHESICPKQQLDPCSYGLSPKSQEDLETNINHRLFAKVPEPLDFSSFPLDPRRSIRTPKNSFDASQSVRPTPPVVRPVTNIDQSQLSPLSPRETFFSPRKLSMEPPSEQNATAPEASSAAITPEVAPTDPKPSSCSPTTSVKSSVSPTHKPSSPKSESGPVEGAAQKDSKDLASLPAEPSISPKNNKSNTPDLAAAATTTSSSSPSTTAPAIAPTTAPSGTRQKRRSIGDWDFLQTIGAGSMGQVKLARNRHTGLHCAVKIVPRAHAELLKHPDKQSRETDDNKDVRTVREAALSGLLHHRNICQLYQMFAMSNHFYMLFEYVSGGQMLDYIIAHGSLKEKRARRFARSIASALDYCHRNSVVHRDLKIENILITSKGEIKIIDFGLSNLFAPNSLLKTFCGSLYFAAPELLNARPYVGPEVDVWSFGIVLYVLVCGKVPFDDQSMAALHAKIKRGRVEYPNWISPDCKDMLSRMLVVDPTERASLSEIMHHPWMNKTYEGPPESMVPPRVPLQLPLDPSVIREMSIMDFGSEPQLTQELTAVLSSQDYQASLENWHRNREGTGFPMTTDPISRASAPQKIVYPDPTAAYHPLISLYFLIVERRRAGQGGRWTSPAGASPIAPSNPSYPQAQNHTPNPALPAQRPDHRGHHISYHAHPPAPPPRVRSKTHGHKELKPALDESQFGPSLQIPSQASSHKPVTDISFQSNDNNGSIVPAIPPKLHTRQSSGGFHSIFRRLSSRRRSSPSRHDFQPTILQNLTSVPAPPQIPPLPDIKPLLAPNDGSWSASSTLQHASSFTRSPSFSLRRKPVSAKPSEQRPRTPPRASAPPAVSVNEQLAVGVAYTPPSRTQSTTHRPKSRSGIAAIGSQLDTIKLADPAQVQGQPSHKRHPRAKSEGGRFQTAMDTGSDFERLGTVGEKGTGYTSTSSDNSKRVSMSKSRASLRDLNNSGVKLSIEYPKQVLLKGFFSVQSTSTKSLPFIRSDIIRVLSNLGIVFTEIRGGFSCVFSPSLAEGHGSSAAGGKMSFSPSLGPSVSGSNSGVGGSQGESISLAPPSDASPAGRKRSIGTQMFGTPRRWGTLGHWTTSNSVPSSNSIAQAGNSADLDSDLSSEGLHPPGASEMLGNVPSSSSVRTPLQFEVYIVRVPLLALHGVQFKKLSGNSWQYKSLATTILSQLRL